MYTEALEMNILIIAYLLNLTNLDYIISNMDLNAGQ